MKKDELIQRVQQLEAQMATLPADIDGAAGGAPPPPPAGQQPPAWFQQMQHMMEQQAELTRQQLRQEAQQARQQMQDQLQRQDDLIQQLRQQQPPPPAQNAANVQQQQQAPANPPAPPAHQPAAPRAPNLSALSPIPQDVSFKGFRDWRRMWNNNAQVYALHTFPRHVQVYSVVTAMGQHAANIVQTHFNVNLDAAETTVEGILDQLQTYYRAQRSVAIDRVAFHARKQGQNERFDKFRFALVDLAEDAQLCEHCRDTQLVTQIIVGTSDEEARRALELESEASFKAMQLAWEAQRNGEAIDVMDVMSNPQSILRAEMGDDAYARYLEAQGQPTAIRITQVLGGSPGDSAGLQPGDELVSYNGERVFSVMELRNGTMQGQPGEDVVIEIERDGVRMQLTLPRGPIGITGSGANIRGMSWWGG